MDEEFESPEVWDEYQWERFLQEQDRNTEKYFGLLEKYLDHPERDQVIAKEMGWAEYSDEEEDEAMAEMEELMASELAEEEERFDEEDLAGRYLESPVYQEMVMLHHWVENWFEKEPSRQENPHAVRLATRLAVCSAKLAAALSQEDDDDVELGMVIAYLKRGLKAANDSLDASQHLAKAGLLEDKDHQHLNQMIFSIRNQIVDLMQECRIEWQRRYGQDL